MNERFVCANCGGRIVRAKTTARAKGWAHEVVTDSKGGRHPLSEHCRIDGETLKNIGRELATPTLIEEARGG